MTRPAIEVADILRAQGNRFLERYQSSFSYQQLKAFRAIVRCRTAALGGHIDQCHGCGYEAGISYNSRRSRCCPKCQARSSRAMMKSVPAYAGASPGGPDTHWTRPPLPNSSGSAIG